MTRNDENAKKRRILIGERVYVIAIFNGTYDRNKRFGVPMESRWDTDKWRGMSGIVVAQHRLDGYPIHTVESDAGQRYIFRGNEIETQAEREHREGHGVRYKARVKFDRVAEHLGRLRRSMQAEVDGYPEAVRKLEQEHHARLVELRSWLDAVEIEHDEALARYNAAQEQHPEARCGHMLTKDLWDRAEQRRVKKDVPCTGNAELHSDPPRCWRHGGLSDCTDMQDIELPPKPSRAWND